MYMYMYMYMIASVQYTRPVDTRWPAKKSYHTLLMILLQVGSMAIEKILAATAHRLVQ